MSHRFEDKMKGTLPTAGKIGSLAAAAALLWQGTARAAWEWNLQAPKSPIAHEVYNLHAYIFWVCVGIFFVVFGTMFYSIYKHRKSVGHKAEQFHENTTVEVIWTIIPFLILLVLAWPATKTVLAMKDTAEPDLTIKVTASQWKWNYDYLHDGFDFYSNLKTPLEERENVKPKNPNYLLEVDQPMVVPVKKKVRFLITSADVIHTFFVPSVGVQQDAMPGFVRDSWATFEEPGIYRGQCNKICGKEHAFMPVIIEAKEQKDYDAWVAEHKKAAAAKAEDPNKEWTQPELMAKGEQVYKTVCGACHQPNGQGLPNAFPPLAGSKVVTGPKEDQIKLVLNGRKGVFKPDSAMPPQNTLSDTDIAAAITYTRNSFGNHTGEAIQPAEVKAAR
jgi:cytochrome c oxidase subunit 2